VEALIAAPLFSAQDPSVFHADPHAGNLLYDEANRELIVLDWALAERLSRETRRQLILLAMMVAAENREGARAAIRALRRKDRGDAARDERIVDRGVERFFDGLPAGHVPGVLDAMRLLDGIALEGVPFAAPLFLFRKSLFTLNGVLQDVCGSEVRMDHAMMRHFLTRLAASFGLFYSPLRATDLLALEWNALMYPARAWKRRLFGGGPSDSGRTARDSRPSPTKKSPRRAKAPRRAPRRQRSRQGG
jgi:ubiquinone biosynthesis protein